MGGVFSRVVSPEDNNRWLASFSPVKGEFNAFMAGIAAASLFQESKFGLEWERSVMKRMQTIEDRWGIIELSSWVLGKFCSGEVLPMYFAMMYWVLDRYKCVYGIWLVPMSEVINGLLKWHYHTPRPGWVDRDIKLREWSDEYSFPSSHSQIVWALANFFTFTSISKLRTKLFGPLGSTALAYWYFLAGPYLWALCVSLSRVYDGLHYPRDVTVGAGIGVVLSAVYIEILPIAKAFLEKQPIPHRMLYLQIVPLTCMVLVKASYERVKKREIKEEWSQTAGRGRFIERKVSPHDVPYASYTGMIGVLSGLGVAEPLLPYFPLSSPRSIPVALGRILVGNVGFALSFLAIRHVEMKFQKWPVIYRCIRWVRYMYIPVYILMVAPPIFRKIGL